MACVCVWGPLKKLAGGRSEHELGGATVVDLLVALEREHPAVAGWILDERGLSTDVEPPFVAVPASEASTEPAQSMSEDA